MTVVDQASWLRSPEGPGVWATKDELAPTSGTIDGVWCCRERWHPRTPPASVKQRVKLQIKCSRARGQGRERRDATACCYRSIPVARRGRVRDIRAGLACRL